jgi:flotillin
MRKKDEAYESEGQADILDKKVKIIPEVAQHVSEPIAAIKNMNVYGTSGADAAGISGAVPTVIKQSFDVIESATGVNMSDIVRANTIEAKVTRNVNLDSDNKIDVDKKN